MPSRFNSPTTDRHRPPSGHYRPYQNPTANDMNLTTNTLHRQPTAAYCNNDYEDPRPLSLHLFRITFTRGHAHIAPHCQLLPATHLSHHMHSMDTCHCGSSSSMHRDVAKGPRLANGPQVFVRLCRRPLGHANGPQGFICVYERA